MKTAAGPPPRPMAPSDLMRWQSRSRIPDDQKALLQNTAAWAVHLKNQPRGVAHVPDHVLETAKAAHLLGRKAKAKRSARQAPDPAPAPSPAPAPASSPPQDKRRDGELPESSMSKATPPPSDALSWETTPPRSADRRAALYAPGIRRAAPDGSSGDEGDEAEAEPSPPRPSRNQDSDSRSGPRAAPSLGPATAPAPPTTTTATLKTPPCGQGQRAIVMCDSCQRPGNPGLMSAVKAQGATRRDSPETARTGARPIHVPASFVVPASRRQTLSPSRKSAAAPPSGHDDMPLPPYEAFTATYPDYTTRHSGTLWKFVQACVCLEILQRERTFREFWYDDFIQAFCGYIRYVKNSGPGHEPVPANEWYGCIRGPMLYDRMVVNRDNLAFILTFYPAEAARAGAIVEGGNNPDVNVSTSLGPRWQQPQAQLQPPTPRHPVHDEAQAEPSEEPQPQHRAASPELGSDPIEPEPARHESPDREEQPQEQPIQSIEPEPPQAEPSSPPQQPPLQEPPPGQTNIPSTQPPPPPPPSERPQPQPTSTPAPASTPKRHPLPSMAPVSSSLKRFAASGNEPPSSARSLKRRKMRSSAERQRLWEHFRKGLPSSSAISRA